MESFIVFFHKDDSKDNLLHLDCRIVFYSVIAQRATV